MKIVRAIRQGRIVPNKPKTTSDKPQFYNIWNEEPSTIPPPLPPPPLPRPPPFRKYGVFLSANRANFLSFTTAHIHASSSGNLISLTHCKPTQPTCSPTSSVRARFMISSHAVSSGDSSGIPDLILATTSRRQSSEEGGEPLWGARGWGEGGEDRVE